MLSFVTCQRSCVLVFLVFIIPVILFSQQYPVLAESPTVLPAGTAHAEVGIGEYFDQSFPLSGLDGDLTKLGILHLGFSYDGNVELQFDGTLLDVLKIKSRDTAFNSAIATTNSVSADIGDFTLWTKLRLVSEYGHFSAVSIRFGVQLPNASNESGLGIDEFNFYSSFLFEKHYGGFRWLVNAGLGILGDPATLSEQHDTFIFAFGSYIPVGDKSTLVFEAAGRTGHHGIGVYRLANAKVGVQTSFSGLSWKLAGVMSFAPSDNSKGVELLIGYDFAIFENSSKDK
jgi:hypothetical protein